MLHCHKFKLGRWISFSSNPDCIYSVITQIYTLSYLPDIWSSQQNIAQSNTLPLPVLRLTCPLLLLTELHCMLCSLWCHSLFITLLVRQVLTTTDQTHQQDVHLWRRPAILILPLSESLRSSCLCVFRPFDGRNVRLIHGWLVYHLSASSLLQTVKAWSCKSLKALSGFKW